MCWNWNHCTENQIKISPFTFQTSLHRCHICVSSVSLKSFYLGTQNIWAQTSWVRRVLWTWILTGLWCVFTEIPPRIFLLCLSQAGHDMDLEMLEMDESCNPTLYVTDLSRYIFIHDLILITRYMTVSAVAHCQKRNKVCGDVHTLLLTHNWLNLFKCLTFRWLPWYEENISHTRDSEKW